MLQFSGPNFLRDLLTVLGRPHTIKFSVSGNGISKEAIKIGELEGVKLEDRYVDGAPVYLEGKASIEKIMEIYQRQYEYFMLTTLSLLQLNNNTKRKVVSLIDALKAIKYKLYALIESEHED